MLTQHLQLTKEFRSCPFTSVYRAWEELCHRILIEACPLPSGESHKEWWGRKGHPLSQPGQLNTHWRSTGDAAACGPQTHHSVQSWPFHLPSYSYTS